MDCIDIFHRKMEALTAESLNGLHGYGGEFERVCESHQHLLSWFVKLKRIRIANRLNIVNYLKYVELFFFYGISFLIKMLCK